MVGDGDCRCRAAASIGHTGGGNGVSTTACRRSVEAAVAYASYSGIATHYAVNVPGHTQILRVAAQDSGELLNLRIHHDCSPPGSNAYHHVGGTTTATTAVAAPICGG